MKVFIDCIEVYPEYVISDDPIGSYEAEISEYTLDWIKRTHAEYMLVQQLLREHYEKSEGKTE